MVEYLEVSEAPSESIEEAMVLSTISASCPNTPVEPMAKGKKEMWEPLLTSYEVRKAALFRASSLEVAHLSVSALTSGAVVGMRPKLVGGEDTTKSMSMVSWWTALELGRMRTRRSPTSACLGGLERLKGGAAALSDISCSLSVRNPGTEA